MSAAPTSWYVATTGNHQRIIIGERTGANTAVAYEAEHAPLLAAAPDLLAALQDAAEQLQHYLLSAESDDDAESAYQHARAAIEKAREK